MASFIRFALLLSTLACVLPTNGFVVSKEGWKEWRVTHGLNYDFHDYGEIYKSVEAWEKNMIRVVEHNNAADAGDHTYWLEMNRFADGLAMDLLGQDVPFVGRTSICDQIYPVFYANDLPDSVDWRKKGAVYDVQDQGSSGKSWTFSATGALEGLNFIQTGKLVKLSEQNLADCATANFSSYCQVGSPECAFYYVARNGGIDTEDGYQRTSLDGKCHYDPSAVGATCSGCVSIPSGDEYALQQAVANQGPISVIIDASSSSFQLYQKGVYNDANCGQNLNHAVLIVGYGTENGLDYWIVKNSWGELWGEEGYIRIARNQNNLCGIASRASYPTA